MNKLHLYVKDNGDIDKAIYEEELDGFVYEELLLSQKEKNDLFDRIMTSHRYMDFREFRERNITHCVFNDIDVDMMDKLIEKSRRNKKLKKRDMAFEDSKLEKTKPKLSRFNKFNGKRVIATVALLTTLFMTAKVAAKTSATDKAPSADLPPSSIEIMTSFNKNSNIVVLDNYTDDDSSKKEVKPIKEDILADDVSIDESSEPEEISYDQIIFLETEDLSDSEKAYMARAYYFDTISEIANEYGIDPALALAICTQERGMHSNDVEQDGGIGLFQIQVEGAWNWDGKQITAYNFNKQCEETLTITKEGASDVFQNIRYGCMILQASLRQLNYNIAQGVTYYNCGNYLYNPILSECCNQTGFTTEEINNPNNLEWLNYRNLLKCGDAHYLENVFKYIPDGTVLHFTKPNGDTITVSYDNLNITSYRAR